MGVAYLNLQHGNDEVSLKYQYLMKCLGKSLKKLWGRARQTPGTGCWTSHGELRLATSADCSEFESMAWCKWCQRYWWHDLLHVQSTAGQLWNIPSTLKAINIYQPSTQFSRFGFGLDALSNGVIPSVAVQYVLVISLCYGTSWWFACPLHAHMQAYTHSHT